MTKTFRHFWIRVLLAGLALVWSGDSTSANTSFDGSLNSIPSRGGRFFATRIELPVPAFTQADARWSHQLLGPTTDTLGDEGCTLTSVVMVLNFYGIKTDPASFNRYLTAHFGYDSAGYLAFGQVCTVAPRVIRLAYEGPCSYESLDRNLVARHPIIVQLTLESGDHHFVVIAGKQGFDYLVRDPAADPADLVGPLAQITPRMDREYLYLKKL